MKDQNIPDDNGEAEIEASKAPLMEHLIELRSRLIKALAAFFLACVFCFFFAKQIYNILVWPYVWIAGAENSKFIYTALLEYFITQLKLALIGAAIFLACLALVPIIGHEVNGAKRWCTMARSKQSRASDIFCWFR